MRKIENIGNKAKKAIFGKVFEVGVKKGIGFMPVEDYYIDENVYLFGIRIKSKRYWKESEFKNKKKNDKRTVVKGFVYEKKEVI